MPVAIALTTTALGTLLPILRENHLLGGRLGAHMLAAGAVDADTMLAMGELSARFDTRQRLARQTLERHHDDYFGARSAAHVDRLVSG